MKNKKQQETENAKNISDFSHNSQEEESKEQDDFEAWLNVPSQQGRSGTGGYGQGWFHIEPNDTTVLNFLLYEDIHKPEVVERVLPNCQDPTAPPRTVKRAAFFKVYTDSEPGRVRTWEVSRTTAVNLYPLLKKGLQEARVWQAGFRN